MIVAAATALGAGLWATEGGPFAAAFLRIGPERLIRPFLQLSPSALLIHLGHLVKALALISIMLGSGYGVLRLVALTHPSALLRACLAFGVGAGTWGLAFLGLGLAQLLHTALLWCVLGAGAVFAVDSLRRELATAGSSPDPGDATQSVAVFCLAAPMLLALFTLLPFALVPETFYDALEYHLGLPHLYLLERGIKATPDNAFAGSPSIPAMVNGFALLFDKWGITAHLLNLFVFIWALACIAATGGLLAGRLSGLMAATLYATMPVVISAGYLTTVELWWTAFSFGSVASYFLAVREPASSIRTRWLVLCGVLLGLAMSTKYIAWAAPFGFIMAWLASRNSKGGLTHSEVGTVALAAFIVLSPWLIKNLVHYKNPIYPFFHERIVPSAEVMPGWRYLGTDTAIAFSAQGRSYLGNVAASAAGLLDFGGRHAQGFGPALVLVLCLFLAVRTEGEQRVFAIFSSATWLPYLLVTRLPRYHLPAVGFFTLAACLGLSKLGKPTQRWLVYLVSGFSVVYILILGSVLLQNPQRVAFSTARFTEYLNTIDQRNLYAPPLHPAVRVLESLPVKGRILVFGDARGLYLPHPYIISTPGQPTVLERIANSSGSAQEMREKLSSLGVELIAVNYVEIYRTKQPLRFSPSGLRVLTDFWAQHVSLVESIGPSFGMDGGRRVLDSWIGVYRIQAGAKTAAQPASDDLIKNIESGPIAAKPLPQ